MGHPTGHWTNTNCMLWSTQIYLAVHRIMLRNHCMEKQWEELKTKITNRGTRIVYNLDRFHKDKLSQVSLFYCLTWLHISGEAYTLITGKGSLYKILNSEPTVNCSLCVLAGNNLGGHWLLSNPFVETEPQITLHYLMTYRYT